MKRFFQTCRRTLTALCLVAAGVSGLFATSRAVPKIQQRPDNLLRTPYNPEGNLYAVVPSFYGIQSVGQAFYAKVDPNTGHTTTLYRSETFSNQAESYVETGIVLDDILYIPQLYYGADGMVTQEANIIWKRFDVKKGETLSPVNYGNTQAAHRMFLYGMTYDSSRNKIYGLKYNLSTDLGGALVEIDCSGDPQNWKATDIMDLCQNNDSWVCNIVYNPINHLLYSMREDGTFNEIDVDAKTIVPVMQYDEFYDFAFPPSDQTTSIVYSPNDHAFIYALVTSGSTQFCSIDAETYEVTDLGFMSPFGFVSTLYCPDPYADDNAPAAMSVPTFNFKDAELKGTYTVTAPNTLFNGDEILANSLVAHIIVDGAEVEKFAIQPGETVTREITMTQGQHTVETYCSANDAKGAVTSAKLYVGNDTPAAPSNLNLADGKLSWRAVEAKGIHDGYINPDFIAYNIYLNGNKLNAEPVSATEYAFNINEQLLIRSNITVTATAAGLESEVSQAVSRVVGKGFDLPAAFTPTAKEADLFEIVNPGNNSYKFTFMAASGTNPDMFRMHIQDTYYNEQPNDWLFLPPVYIESATDVYELAYTYANSTLNARNLDNLEIRIGADPLPEAMTATLYSHTARSQSEPTEETVKFTVDKPGTYFIGFHTCPDPDKAKVYRGIRLYDFEVKKSNANVNAPAALDNFKAVAASKGELFVHVTANIPTKSISGNNLDPEADITVTAKTDTDTKTFVGKPGAPVELLLEVPTDGFTPIRAYASSSDGDGLQSLQSVYVGYDNPLPPTNLRCTISPDNKSLTLEWDPVSSVGEHGGYVDLNEVTYDIYSVSTTGSTKLGSAGKTNSFVYKVDSPIQVRLTLTPVAQNSMGTSVNGTVLIETLGRLYKLPMTEEFPPATFNLQKWLFTTVAPYNNVEWSHTIDETGNGIGDPVFSQPGALKAINAGHAGSLGQLVAPRATTLDNTHVMLHLSYWDCPKSAHMEVWGRSSDSQTFEKIDELDPARGMGSWKDWDIILDDAKYAQKDWVQLNVRCRMDNADDIVLIDNYKLLQNSEYDFTVNSVDAPYSTFVGETPTFLVTVANSGAEPSTGSLQVHLLGDDNIIATQEVAIGRIQPGAKFQYEAQFEMFEDYYKYDYMSVRASATCPNDDNVGNNECAVDFLLYDSQIPVVRDLTAVRAENGQDVNLSWSKPDTTFPELDSFEMNAALDNTDVIGRWINTDLDGKVPFVLENKRFEGDDQPCAWMVVNHDDFNTASDDRLSAHTGKQMLLARSVAYDQESEKPTRNYDWLISPEVDGGNTVSFWFNTLSSSYTETLQIYYSTTDTMLDPDNIIDDGTENKNPRGCGSFKWLCNFTKSGEETWEQCEFTLPEDAKYFAIVYASYGQFGALIDDIRFKERHTSQIDLDSYDVLCSVNDAEPTVVGIDIQNTSWTHKTTDQTKNTYYVVSKVFDVDRYYTSARSNPVTVAATGVGTITDGNVFVGGGKGRILVGGAEGKTLNLYDVDGRAVKNIDITSGRQSFTCNAGVYIAKVGNSTFKVVVR